MRMPPHVTKDDPRTGKCLMGEHDECRVWSSRGRLCGCPCHVEEIPW
jgi:hypothetical protein